ncbi:MAG: cellulase family glycosylhydrolase, partial [Chitinispirillia bacterium]
LLFEILNEPNTKLTPKKWNMLLAETFPIIRESNPTRPVIIGTAEWGGVAALSKLVLPKDPNIILTIHYYSPMEFTHQGASWVKNSNAWLGTKWQGTYFQKLAIVSDFDYARHYAKKNNIPVFIGEFGALETADIESREKWNAFCTRLLEKYGFSWAYWEFSSGFGVYNNDSKKWNDALLNALMSSDTSILAMGKPKLGKNILKNGDFSRDTSSWYLQIIDSLSEVTFSTDSNGFTIKPGKKDTLGYYIQLTQFKINLKKGRSYVLMFDISAASERSIAAYSGLARAPWDKYYGSNWNVTAFGQIRTIAIPFTMTEDDPEARVSFDFGGDTVETTLANVKLLDLDEAAIKITRYKPFDTGRITAYPVRNGLLVNLNRPFRGKVSASIFSPYGKVMVRVHDIVPDNNSTFALPFSNRTQNLWILHVTSSLFSESILLNNF